MTEREALITLNMLSSIGSIRLKNLLEYFKSPLKILSSPKEKLVRVEGIGEKIASQIVEAKRKFDLKKELELAKREDVKIITINDDSYPENLKQIYDPPIVLYVKGEIGLPEDKKAIAIVGSRRASYYGLSAAERFAESLALLGITIVSGMARGIDSQAHRGALRVKGRTIAVSGSGLLNIYPPENKGLFQEIFKSGAVISEFPMETLPLAQNFPRRNRIISGLSLGVLVVEAARNSGALITADFALEQGREVFAVPGKVDSSTSWGTNQLIKQGAKLVDNIEEIIEELSPHLRELPHILKRKPQDLQRREERQTKETLRPSLTYDEERVYNTLSPKPKHFDEILMELEFPISKVISSLVNLEMRRLIKELPGKLFVKNINER